MKLTSVIGVLLGLALLPQSAVAQKMRIGVVDMQRAVSETDEGRRAESRLKALKSSLESTLNRQLQAFQEEEQKLRKAWSILKDAEKRKRAAESRQKFEQLQKQYIEAERKLMAQKTKAMMSITKKLTGVIKRIADRDKFDYIFANAAVLWAPRHVDVTNEVIRMYNGKK